jgi:UDP-GlcNAc:undecaprenyl-phosphate GlcNAc-1-phosphate transferase
VVVTLFGTTVRIPFSLILFVISLVSALAFTPLVIAAARRWGALDHPGPRRIHESPVPTLGGIAMAFSVLAACWLAFWIPGPVRERGVDTGPLLGFTLACVPILILGALDDLKGTSPPVKLIFQAAAAVILTFFGFGIPVISLPLGGGLATGPFNVPLTVGWVLIVINAINLVDGLDGLAAGAVFIASMALWWIGRTHADIYVMFVTAALAGATLGFLRYNFPPARIFMGDTGSHFLGLTLAAVSLIDNRKGATTITLLFPLVVIGVPILDSGLAFFRRFAGGQPVFRGDSEHIHHRLLRIGLSKRAALFVLWYLCAYLGVMAILLSALPHVYTWFVLVVLVMGLYLALQVLEFVDRREARKPPTTS